MKNFFACLSLAVFTTMPVTGASAQEATQRAVLGNSGNPNFPVEVEGTNGVIYSCRSELTQTANGQSARSCIRAGSSGGGVFDSATGLTVAGAAGGFLILVAAIGGDGDDATATTTTAIP